MHKQRTGTMAGLKSGVTLFLLIVFPIIVSDYCMGRERFLITILYTSKMQGNIDPCGCSKNRLGGIETRASLLRLMKSEDNHHTLLVDSGDAFASQRLYEAFNKARRDFLVKVMNYMGYEVLNIGDTEFGFNQTALKELRAKSKFFLISSNIMDKTTGEPFFTPYVIRTVGDIKIAFLGLITDNLPSRIPQEHIKSLVFADPMITVKKYVPILRKKSDLIVVLSDLGLSQDKALAEVIPDIDIIIGGHDGKILYDPIKIGKVLVLQAGDRGQYVGKLTLEFNEQKKIMTSRNELIPADNKVYKPDPYVRKLLKDYRAKERTGRVYGRDDRREKLILPLPQPSGE